MTPPLRPDEPADWRAALATGALRAPSLVDAGFVHLSTPGQVHLPAGRLFPGRRDVVPLVVDPHAWPARCAGNRVTPRTRPAPASPTTTDRCRRRPW